MDYKEKLRRRQQQAVADKGKTGLGRKSVLDFSRTEKTVNFFQPRTGRGEVNAIDIMPFVVSQKWYKDLRTPSGRPIGLDAGDRDYVLTLPVHRGVGPNNDMFLCLREAFGGKCVICDDMFEFYRQNDKEKARSCKPSWRCFYNVYDYDDPDKGFQLWEISYFNFEATSRGDPQRANLVDAFQLSAGGIVLFSDLEEGSTIIAKFKERNVAGSKTMFPEVFEISFENREPYKDDILEQVFPLDALVVIPDPETVKNAHYGIDEGAMPADANDIPEGEEEKEPPPETRQAAPARTRTREPQLAAKPESAPDAGRTRTRNAPSPQPEEPKPESPKQASDAPPWDEDGNWGQCPAGGNFGYDCNQLAACTGQEDNSCAEEMFEECRRLTEERGKAAEKESQKPRKPPEQPKAVPAPAQRGKASPGKPPARNRRGK